MGFDVFYFIRKLEMSLVQLNMEGVIKTHFQYHLLDEILAHIDTQTQLQSNPLLFAYYLAVRMFRKEEHDSYFLLKNFLTLSSDKLPIWDVRNLSNALLNYCIKRVSASKDWEKERMEITFLQVEKGLVYNDSGNISGPVFINVLTVALKISRERASNFIRENLSKLPTDIQDNMKIYCEALIAFEEHQLKEVIRLLNLRAITDDIYLEIRAQRLLIKAYFEAEDPYIENVLNTFKSYIHYSQVIPLEQKNANDNFRKLLTQILNALSPSKKEQLKLKITHTVELVEREWLMGQLQH